ncbi:MAG: hypothetical protein O7D30_11680, partial [Rickettsia endosymbiont of Ixodes persulcatus]|nr:hypothetical protein [Rickettsia endosymbiont of Ixodes persulcatus]
ILCRRLSRSTARLESRGASPMSVMVDVGEKYVCFVTESRTGSFHPLILVPYRAHLTCFKYSFFPQTIENWNNINGSVRCLDFDRFVLEIQ